MEMKRPAPDARPKTLGTIKSLDAAAHSVTLDSGKICQCGTTVDLGAFKSGDKVSMSFADKNGTSECCEMHIAA